MNQQYCIYSRTLQVLILACCVEFNYYRMIVTALDKSNTITNLITSFCFIFDICYMMKQQYCIYSRILQVLILACCIEFNYYKTRVYCITVFYNTLKLNHIILYHIWYLPHDEPTVLYIFQNTPILILACCIELITTRRELLHYSHLIQSQA